MKPLSQNRVSPGGEIVAASWRGALMGNRGRIAEDPRGGPYWRSGAWVACRLQPLAGRGTTRAYTKLFFSDEAAALAAGHRPCAQCRRDSFEQFRAFWNRAVCGSETRATVIDEALRRERRRPRVRLMGPEAADLPDGSFVGQLGGQKHAYLVKHAQFWRWGDGRYAEVPTTLAEKVCVLTPPSVIAVLREGYRPTIGGLGE